MAIPNDRLEPVESLIEKGLALRFAQVFGVRLVFSNETAKKAARAKIDDGKEPTYPYAFATVASYSLPTTARYKGTALLRRGLTSQATRDRTETYKLSLLPSDTVYNITLVTNSIEQAKAYAKAWLMAAVGGYLKYTITYGVASLDIHLEMATQVDIPEMDSNPGSTQEIEVTASITVQGYLSKAQLAKQQAATSVELEGRIANTEIEKALKQEGSAGSVQVFAFKTEWPEVYGPDADAPAS